MSNYTSTDATFGGGGSVVKYCKHSVRSFNVNKGSHLCVHLSMAGIATHIAVCVGGIAD